jgi:hypothetical protein
MMHVWLFFKARVSKIWTSPTKIQDSNRLKPKEAWENTSLVGSKSTEKTFRSEDFGRGVWDERGELPSPSFCGVWGRWGGVGRAGLFGSVIPKWEHSADGSDAILRCVEPMWETLHACEWGPVWPSLATLAGGVPDRAALHYLVQRLWHRHRRYIKGLLSEFVSWISCVRGVNSVHVKKWS